MRSGSDCIGGSPPAKSRRSLQLRMRRSPVGVLTDERDRPQGQGRLRGGAAPPSAPSTGPDANGSANSDHSLDLGGGAGADTDADDCRVRERERERCSRKARAVTLADGRDRLRALDELGRRIRVVVLRARARARLREEPAVEDACRLALLLVTCVSGVSPPDSCLPLPPAPGAGPGREASGKQTTQPPEPRRAGAEEQPHKESRSEKAPREAAPVQRPARTLVGHGGRSPTALDATTRPLRSRQFPIARTESRAESCKCKASRQAFPFESGEGLLLTLKP